MGDHDSYTMITHNGYENCLTDGRRAPPQHFIPRQDRAAKDRFRTIAAANWIG